MKAWCKKCRGQRLVNGTSEESYYSGPKTETVYQIEWLECGHPSRQSEGREIPVSW